MEKPTGYKIDEVIDGVIIHLTESENQPEIPADNQQKTIETFRVYLNNDWQVTDEVGTIDFEQKVKNITNIHWFTFISEKNNF